jgi:hypothetical protein
MGFFGLGPQQPPREKPPHDTKMNKSRHPSKMNKSSSRTGEIPADPAFMKLWADVRSFRLFEPADGSDWPEHLEPRAWKRLINYLSTAEAWAEYRKSVRQLGKRK